MFRFEYDTSTGVGVCGVTVSRRALDFIMLTEIPDNPGMSVTNAVGVIAETIVNEWGLEPWGVIWIEHYPGTGNTEPTFDLVGLKWRLSERNGWVAAHPKWKRVSWEFVCEIIPEEDIPSWN